MIENFFINIKIFKIINNFTGTNYYIDIFFKFCAENLIYLMLGFFIAYFLKKIYKDQKVEIREFFIYFSSAILTYIITIIIKKVYPIERPDEFLKNVNLLIDYGKSGLESFPSGHASFSFSLFATVFIYNKKLSLFFFLGALMVSFSRIYVGVHFPLDILLGAILGIFITFVFYKIFIKKKSFD